jgi:anti-anti-sigma factor
MAKPLVHYIREDDDAVTRLVVVGDVDLANVDEFNEHLARLVDDAHSPAVLDLRRLTFFGSTALNSVLVAHRRAEAEGVQLVIRPSPMVLRVIHICGLDSMLHLG